MERNVHFNLRLVQVFSHSKVTDPAAQVLLVGRPQVKNIYIKGLFLSKT